MKLIPKICEMLGVEVGEEFKVTRYANVVFRFDETSLQFFATLNNDWREVSDELYKMIMKGDTEVKRLPFKPKEHELYWYVYVGDDEIGHTRFTEANTNDLMRVYCGNCFRSEAEAQAHKQEIYEKLTGKKWENTGESEEKS